MKAASWVLVIFPVVWAEAALVIAGAPRVTLFLPPLAFLLLIWGGRKSFYGPRQSSAKSHRPQRNILVWSVLEAVAAMAAAVALWRLEATTIVAPVVCIVAGLHVFPLAHGVPRAAYYYAMGVVLVIAGLGVAVILVQTASAFAASSTAIILWIGALAFMLKTRRRQLQATATSA